MGNSNKKITLNNLKRFYLKIKELLNNKSDLIHTHNADSIIEDSKHMFITELEKEKINEISSSIEETMIFSTSYIIEEETNKILFPEEFRNKIVNEQLFVNGIKLIKNIHYQIDENYEYIKFTKSYNNVEIELLIYNKVKQEDISFATIEEIRELFL